MQGRRRNTTNAFGISYHRRRQEADEDVEPRTHSRALDRHFDGYTEEPVLSPDGKIKSVRRIYTGTIYRQELEKNDMLRLRISHAVLYIAGAGLLIASALLPVRSNNCWYTLLMLLLSMACFAWLFMLLLSYLPSGAELKISEYERGAKQVPSVAGYAVASVLLPMAATAVQFYLSPAAFSLLEALRLLLLALSGACIYILGRRERAVKYTVILPPEEGSGDAEEEEQE